ncbi:hypothetical protein TraAM80_06379 [Trypanosoma rangeli]|uniref:C2 domain-containing protein n=1 Tax=Trypanosoma rangeli TaxID=5698 RepID=A0A422NAK9_TRYRA|nr:uncharacterized protein TraAM80_06379 [Trypanosoma rangeli]RNF02483.1 hypothetical protein TraAM80_06379 [Trypanosoma rangeli]|eukprot:RNF02483.1 hypothetical protein TraAM80_06379 [Trypanosoma rangeli]
MAVPLLPAEFRCFRHITHIYARNVSLPAVKATVKAPDDGGVEASALDTTSMCAAVRCGRRTALRPRCVSSYFVLSLPPGKAESVQVSAGDRRIYTSEVRRDTQNPVWDHIPEVTLEQFGEVTCFVFSLYCCTTHSEEAVTAPETDFLFYEMLIQTSHVEYVAASMTKADALPSLPYHVENRPNSFVVLLRCTDGIFFPKHQGMQVDEEGVVVDPIQTPYLCEDGDPLRRLTDVDAARSQGKGIYLPQEKITLGDLKTCATATLAWSYLSELAADRRGELQDDIDGMMESSHGEAAAVAQRAMLEARLTEAREKLECLFGELRELRARYKEEQDAMTLQMAQLGELQSSIALEAVREQETRERLPEHELSLATLRVQLEGVRRLRLEELRVMFPINEGAAGLADTICGYCLPERGKGLGAANDTMHDWGLALGATAHLITTAATIYGCTLPRPLLLCGGRSCVMEKSGLATAAVISPVTGLGDVKLPLFCARAADRPLMAAAMQLLLEDVAAVAKAMGRYDVAANAENGDVRLGTMLKQLLAPV